MIENNTAIVVPCYNEGRRIDIPAFRSFLDTADAMTVLLFVDDGSTDNTRDVLTGLAAGRKNAELLRMPTNSGKAEAVRFGICHAFARQAQYTGFWDADLATPLPVIPEFVRLLEQQPQLDMVFGARVKLLGRQVERRAVRHYIGRCFATAASLMLDLPIYDTQCGAKLFRATPDMKKVFADRFLSRWIFDVEVIARYEALAGGPAVAAGKIYEYPLERWVDVKDTKLTVSDYAVTAADLLRIWWKYRRHGRL